MTNTKQATLTDYRKKILEDMDVSFDYYAPYDGVDNHCRWVCVDTDCKRCGDGFKSFPAFKKHLATHHNLAFSELRYMRYFM